MNKSDRGYLKQLLDAGAGVVEVEVLHDDWCPKIRGTGECVCTPIVRILSPEEADRKATLQ